MLVVLAATLTLVGFAYQVEEFVLLGVSVGAVLLCGLVLSVTGARRLRSSVRVDVARVAGRVVVGCRADVTVSVTNVGKGALSGVALDLGGEWHVLYPGLADGRGRQQRRREVPHSTPSTRSVGARGKRMLRRRPLVPLPDVAPGGRWSCEVDVPTAVRGLLSLDGLPVWCVDPLGLVVRHATAGPPVQVVVCPDPDGRSDRSLLPTETGQARGYAPSSVATPLVGADDFIGLRAYVPGDRLTRLHWPSAARTGDLVVRNFVELDDVRRVEVTVDVRPRHVEQSVRLAAVLGAAAVDRGSPVVIRTSTGEELVVESGAEAKTILLEALALIAPASRR